MNYKDKVPREVKNQYAIAIKEDFPNNEIWARCSLIIQNGQMYNIQMGSGTRCSS